MRSIGHIHRPLAFKGLRRRNPRLYQTLLIFVRDMLDVHDWGYKSNPNQRYISRPNSLPKLNGLQGYAKKLPLYRLEDHARGKTVIYVTSNPYSDHAYIVHVIGDPEGTAGPEEVKEASKLIAEFFPCLSQPASNQRDWHGPSIVKWKGMELSAFRGLCASVQQVMQKLLADNGFKVTYEMGGVPGQVEGGDYKTHGTLAEFPWFDPDDDSTLQAVLDAPIVTTDRYDAFLAMFGDTPASTSPPSEVRLKLLRIKRDAAEFLAAEHLKYSDHANWIQHLIITHAAMGMTSDRPGCEGVVPLKREYLEQQLTVAAVAVVLPFLLEHGFIERTSNYVEGEESYGYRLGAVLASLPTIKRRLTNATLDQRLKHFDRADMKGWSKAHRHLRKWAQKCSVMRSLKDEARMITLLSTMPPEVRECVCGIIGMIRDGDLHLKVCRYGRFHSAITCLKRDIRPFLHIGGQRLVNVDIANSQPLFLGLTYLSERQGSDGQVGLPISVGPERQVLPMGLADQHSSSTAASSSPSSCSSSPSPGSSSASPTAYIMPSPALPPVGWAPLSIRSQRAGENCHKCLETKAITNEAKVPETTSGKTADLDPLDPLKDDVKDYLRQCENGTLYNTLMKGMNWTGTKAVWKDQVWFLFLYGPHRTREQVMHPKHPRDLERQQQLERMLPLQDFFSAKFPTIYNWMIEKKRGNYKRLPCDMQTRESRLMIEGVCGRLATEFPEVPIITIHDSIMTPKQHVELVKRLIMEAFAELGVTPTLTVTDYAAEDKAAARPAEWNLRRTDLLSNPPQTQWSRN